MNENDKESNNGPIYLLLFTLFGVFLALGFERYFDKGDFNLTSISFYLLSLLVLGLIFTWNLLPPFTTKIKESATVVASNFITWFLLLILLLIYFTSQTLILTYQRNKTIEILEEGLVPLHIAIEKWVIPRQLTSEQITSIRNYLFDYSPATVTIVTVKHDSEASRYGYHIREALESAGWVVHSKQEEKEKITFSDGLSLHSKHPTKSTKKYDDKNPSPTELLQGAFHKAGIQIYGGSSSGGGSIQEDEYFIYIGARRRDASSRPMKWWHKSSGEYEYR